MIISASRRTDIPAFFSGWFFNRLKEGIVKVRNPMNPKLVREISLEPGLIDCIVFWTKNPQAMLHRLDELDAYPYRYYFLFTITPYDRDLECGLPGKDKIIETFRELSRRIGKERVVWRYDPILFSDRIDEEYHGVKFDYIASRLESYTDRCIISFLDMYKKCERNLKSFDIRIPTAEQMVRTAGAICRIADIYGIDVATCAEDIDFSSVGVRPGKCIDDDLIGKITGLPLNLKKDPYQRKTCCCVESVDIGAYNTCNHICHYCYANSDAKKVSENLKFHDPHSPFLIG